MATLNTKLAKSSRNPGSARQGRARGHRDTERQKERRKERERKTRRECVKHSPRRRPYLHGQSFRGSRRSLYRALLTKNRKLLGWLPHPHGRAIAQIYDSAHAYNRVSTCPVLPVSFTTDSTYQRPSATVHERDASRIPAAFRVPMRPPAPIHPDALSHYRQDALHESAGRTKEERRNNKKKKRARERVEALGRRALNTKRYLGPQSRA